MVSYQHQENLREQDATPVELSPTPVDELSPTQGGAPVELSPPPVDDMSPTQGGPPVELSPTPVDDMSLVELSPTPVDDLSPTKEGAPVELSPTPVDELSTAEGKDHHLESLHQVANNDLTFLLHQEDRDLLAASRREGPIIINKMLLQN